MKARKILWAIAMAGAVLTVPSIGQGANFGIGQVLGKTYAEWSAEWWKWAFDSEFVQFQSGNIDCSSSQNGAVWFLGGTFTGGPEDRTCTQRIPQGKALFFPLVNFAFWNPDDSCPPEANHNCTVEEKRARMDGFFSDQVPGNLLGSFETYACQLSATIDGIPVQNLGNPIVRTQSPVFPIIYPPDDVNDPEMVSDGYWVALPPLSSGEHTIHFTGGLCYFSDSPEAIMNGTPRFSW